MNPLTPIENVLTNVLEWLHTAIGLPWAWAIVALTFLVRIVILPLTIKQIRSMQHMQAHLPELKALQTKYKHDKQRMNEEVMRFYKENKVNPAASCLPLLFQIPIFFSLYYVLKDFEKEVFPHYPKSDLGWLGVVPRITDIVTSHWSGYVLLVVYVGSMLASTYFMSASMDPRQKNMRYVFYAMPFVFIPFVVRFPIGLVLYWSTTNLWTVGQGLATRRLLPRPQPPPKRTSRTPPKEEVEPAPAAAADGSSKPAAGSGQQRVRRRKKKKGPRARR